MPNPDTLRVLEMRLPKGKKERVMEATRPIGMEPIRMRLEQLIISQRVTRGIQDGEVPIAEWNFAYATGMGYQTAQRVVQACQIDAARGGS